MARAESRDATPPLPDDVRVAAVVSTYHREVTEGMLASAAETLAGAGLGQDRLLVVRVPGAFELPLVAQRLARRRDVAAVLCFGLVLKGETEHDRHIAAAVSSSLLSASLQADKPILFGVLTCATPEQALQRARRAAEGGLDKGREVALAAIGVLQALHRAAGPFARGAAAEEAR